MFVSYCFCVWCKGCFLEATVLKICFDYMFASSKENVNFKILSLNVRGIRSPEKRKALFIWLNKQNADIIYLQETYSSKDIENMWRTQWSGKMWVKPQLWCDDTHKKRFRF